MCKCLKISCLYMPHILVVVNISIQIYWQCQGYTSNIDRDFYKLQNKRLRITHTWNISRHWLLYECCLPLNIWHLQLQKMEAKVIWLKVRFLRACLISLTRCTSLVPQLFTILDQRIKVFLARGTRAYNMFPSVHNYNAFLN